MNGVIMMMIGVSIVLAFIVVIALSWGIKNKQFDDESWIALDDSEEALNDAIKLEERKKQALDKKIQDKKGKK